MDTAHLLSLVEHLEENIDELEDNLEPLLSTALTATTKKLPLLDKAKLYVLIVYSIESLLFSYLRLHGVKAIDHPVFNELARVKQYFEKLKTAEEGSTKPRENLSLNKQAAGRIVKNALAGNYKHDLQRAERESKEKLMAKRKLQALEQQKNTQTNPSADNSRARSQGSNDGEEDGEIEETNTQPAEPQPLVDQSSNNVMKAKKDKKDSKRRGVDARKQAKKRKRERQDQGSQKPKKKKKKKGKNKQDRDPLAG